MAILSIEKWFCCGKRKGYFILAVMMLCLIAYLHINKKIRSGDNINSTEHRNAFDVVPSMTLTIRTESIGHLMDLTYCTALRSLSLFWSKYHGNIGFILNKESKKDHEWASSLRKHQDAMGFNFSFYFEPLPKDPSILTKVHRRNKGGYNRQLYSSFIMDQFIETDVIAWADTDAKFTSPITPENVVNGGKLRAMGMNTFHYKWVPIWSDRAKIMIGYPIVCDFMTYFPVYIWRDTLTNCRNHIIKHMNVTSIEEAFSKAGKVGSGTEVDISPVNVIMTYAYYFEKDRYDWHVDIRGHDLNAYNKLHISPGFELKPNDITPDVHVSLHSKYYKDPTKAVNKRGYCLSVKDTSVTIADDIKIMCRQFQNDTMWALFEFCNNIQCEHLTSWCKDDRNMCLNLISNQYKRVKELISHGVFDLDLKKVTGVDIAAKDMGITCPSYF